MVSSLRCICVFFSISLYLANTTSASYRRVADPERVSGVNVLKLDLFVVPVHVVGGVIFVFVVQLERIGFFVVDEDSTPELLVLNRTVTLREAAGKGTAPPGKSRKEEQASFSCLSHYSQKQM